ncbi:MAG: class I SAM-dependent methyltransferase [Pseudomonadota bacterium]
MAGVGSTVRRMLGPLERPVSDLYRDVFVSLEDMAKAVREWAEPQSILEIGCGEGALAELMARDFPEAKYLGIDIIPQLGRMYRGPDAEDRFSQIRAEDLAKARPAEFDVILIVDVLHHVPDGERETLLRSAFELLRPGGALIFKDWIRGADIMTGLVWVADVWIGGDKNVRYMDMAEQRAFIAAIFGEDAVEEERPIRPWSQNHAFLIRKPETA